MKLCYLVNQYPKVSHSFIRREILELERQGADILRIALRGWDQVAVDPLDAEEQSRTRYVLKGGVARLALSLLRCLVTRPSRFCRALLQVLKMSRGSDRSTLLHFASLAEACLAERWIRVADARHIHAHFGTNSAEVALLASILTGVPYSFTVHGPEEFDHPLGLALPEKIRHAAAVLAVSSFGRSQLYRWSDADSWARIEVVRCGLEATYFSRAIETAGIASNTLVCVGRLADQKGTLLLLGALRRVIDSGTACRLVFAGDGELRGEIERRVRSLGLSDHVSVTGWIDSERVRHEINSARALVAPSFAEGLPVVLMEALALGRPVISTWIAGIPELVSSECGWLIPAGDIESLSRAMVDCLQKSPTDLEAMGRIGRSRVAALHDIRTEVAKLAHTFATAGRSV